MYDISMKYLFKQLTCPNCGERMNFKHMSGKAPCYIYYKCPYCCLVLNFVQPDGIQDTEVRFKDLPEDIQEYLIHNNIYNIIDEDLLGSKHKYDRCIFCGSENVIKVKEYDFTYKYKNEERKRHDIIYVCKDCSSQVAFGLFGHTGKEFNRDLEDFMEFIQGLDLKFGIAKCPFCDKELEEYTKLNEYSANYRCPGCGLVVVRYLFARNK